MRCLREYSSKRQERVYAPLSSRQRQRWIEALSLQDIVIKDHHCICSRHFPNDDARNDPQLTLGKRFASPKKQWTGRAKGAKKREEHRRVAATTLQLSPFSSRSPTPTASTSVTPTPPPEPMITSIGEPLQSDYQMHELPTGDGGQEASCPHPDIDEVVVNTALLAQIEALESQNRVLTEKLQVAMDQKSVFGIDNIAGNDKLVNLYTGFPSYDILLAFLSS